MNQLILSQQLKFAIDLLVGFANETARPTELHHYAPKTAKGYLNGLKLFQESKLYESAKFNHYNQITQNEIEAWMQMQGWSAAKNYQLITALRTMGKINQEPFYAAEKLTSPTVRKMVGNQTLYSARELNVILDAPLSCFGIKPLQERNKAMFALVFANLASLDVMRTTHIEHVQTNCITTSLQPMPNNTYQVPKNVMKIIQDHIQSIPYRYPDTTVRSYHPLFFNPKNPSKALTGKCIWQNMSRTLERLFESRKRKGSGEGLTALRLSIARVRYGQGCNENLLLDTLGLKKTYASLPKYLKVDEQLQAARKNALEKQKIYH